MSDPIADIEQNTSAFLLAMGEVGGADPRHDAEITWTVGGSPLGYHNAVTACHASPARADELIEEFRSELERRELPGSWHVSPTMAPRDLVHRLLDAGFEDGGEEPGMIVKLKREPPAIDVQDFAVERVTNAAGLDVYRHVLGRSFGEGPPEADWACRVFERIGLHDDVPWRHFVGRLHKEPCATITMFGTGEVAGIYFVSTLPAFRGRGIGAAITRHAMLEAASLGCTRAVLGASPMGHPVYQRLGFEDVFSYRLLEWSPEPAA